jgi:hypothetical protein
MSEEPDIKIYYEVTWRRQKLGVAKTRHFDDRRKEALRFARDLVADGAEICVTRIIHEIIWDGS